MAIFFLTLTTGLKPFIFKGATGGEPLNDEIYIQRPDAIAILGVSQVTLDKFVRVGRLEKFGGGAGRRALYRRDQCKTLKAELENELTAPAKK